MPGPNLLVDGGFEVWSSATNPTNWTKLLTGASSLNREATVVHSGVYCIRGDVDASNGWAEFYQTRVVKPSTWYRATMWYRTAAGKTVAGFARIMIGGYNKYLQDDGTWQPNGGSYDYDYSGGLDSAGAWARHSFIFKTPAAPDNLNMLWGAFNRAAASSSFYVDDVYLEELGPATYEDLVASPACQRDLLLRITPKEQLRGWTKTSGLVYTYEIDWNDLPLMGSYGATYRALTAVEHNGTALTLKTSSAAVDGAAGSYYYDATSKKLYVRCTDDLAADRESVYIVAFFRLHFASGLGKNAKGKIFDNIYYEPLLNASALGAIESEESDFLTGGGLACGDLALEILNSKRFFDYIWTTWSWKNAAVEILHGGEDLPLTEYATIYSGYVKDEKWAASAVRFDTVNWLELLSRQVPVNPCFGDGVSENARGKPLPLLFGRVTGIRPLCTNTAPADGTEWTIADADYQTLKAVEAVYDAGILVSPSSYIVDLANCKFTFVSYTPTGEISCTAQGAVLSDITGETSTDLMTNASDIIRFLLLEVLGLAATQINTTAFAAAKASLGEYVLGKYIRNRKNLSIYINEIERSVLGIVYQELDGRISFDAFSPLYTEDAVIETQEIAEFEQRAPAEKLFAGVQVYFNPTPATADQQGLDTVGDDDAFEVVEGTNSRARYVDGEETAYKRLYTWLTDEASATYLKQRILYLTNIPMVELGLTVNGLKLFDRKPSDILKISKAIAPGAAGSIVDQFFQIISISKELGAARCAIVVDNFKGGAAQVGIWCSDTAAAWASATDAEKGSQGFWCDDDGLVVAGDWTTANRSVWW
ncbi:MAG: hypothetical protein ABFD52_08805 [Acidobacteriota bacterium]